MYIRPAAEADIPGLMKLLRQVLQVHHLGRPDLFRPDAAKYTPEELQAILADPQRPVFAAVEGGQVLGYAFCIFQQAVGSHILTDVKSLYIDDLCVDEDIRGRGIGRALYSHVRSYAREQGCYNVTLNVWACNESALKFYEKLGLKPQKIGMETVL